jgi:hypothetical protein
METKEYKPGAEGVMIAPHSQGEVALRSIVTVRVYWVGQSSDMVKTLNAAPLMLQALKMIRASEQSMASLSKMERGAIESALAKMEAR